ncbi:4-amino-4-deoxy-L-arabinose-phospho-UDP flippase [Candidatus Williamhamiltonella defendens]|uniref:Probable 4-amino-4-deoxy-L-arabinose-phosphoundecaprenol flippase subunit ArnF n=1 Tax=Candidatus Williamhamiltonella defendens TaxID=138072 RepID=A0A2D3T3E6_9ENTR|nr:4-amino-4-deoxy-L-arabinose-phosphoundecaprenol flippase subunit ArnF [Candidatus Hamiltonella defensa]ATW30310.1 4-amino-4-deoxy-L-arabinose-phospho-UDP flippase [Candidatus Hamiltonella defensa]ATW32323.1 4-amino-4-deoxy-L-arabinose-phospho-UDP flippase [Candidatus Hamiltonella defensa]
MKGYLYGLSSVLLASFAQLLLKWGMIDLPKTETIEINLSFVIAHMHSLMAIILGLLAYMISMLSWFFTLRYLPLHQAYPLISMSYALVYLAAVSLPCFNETATILKTLGVSLVLLGIWIVVFPAKHKKITH